MSGCYGERYRLSLFGESHGPAIGIVLNGVPAGLPIDEAAIARDMARRAPGLDPTATARREPDAVRILSGVFEGFATGAPICGVIENTNVRSGDYAQLRTRMRPGHADYAGYVRYGGFNDPRGGGHFSGRLTAPLVFAGSIAKQVLARHGICVGAHIEAIAHVRDARFDPVHVCEETLRALSDSRFPLLDPEKEEPMREAVRLARAQGDSVGGVVECAAVGVPAGIGSPFFASVESVTSALAFSVPAVKAVEFGDGADVATLHGSEANDPMRMCAGRVQTTSNHNGGVTGGVTNGMPVILRVAIKPTPSIAKVQQSVNIATGRDEDLTVTGRHDPCIVPRAVVVVESVLAIALCDLLLDRAADAGALSEGERRD